MKKIIIKFNSMVDGPDSVEDLDETDEVSPGEESSALKKTFLKQFIEFQMGGGDGRSGINTEGSKFINALLAGGKITRTLKKNLETFKKYHTKFQDLDLETITDSDILDEASGQIMVFTNKRQKVKDQISIEFDISAPKYSNVLDNSLNELSLNELDMLLTSGEKRGNILSENFKGDIPKRRSLLNILEGIDLSERVKKKIFGGAKKEKLEEILSALASGDTSEFVFEDLFNLDLFTVDEKREIISAFIPSITLQDAINWNMISETKANDIKTVLLQDNYSKILDTESIPSIRKLKKIATGMSNGEINVSTSDYLSSNADINSLIKGGGLGIMAQSFRDLQSNQEEHIKEHAPENFKDFIDELKNLDNITGGSKFDTGAVVTFVNIDKEGNEHVTFAEIIDKGNESGLVTLMSKGIDSYNSELGESNSRTYNELLKYFNGSETDKPQVQLYSKKEFRDMVSHGEIPTHNNNLQLLSEDEINTDVGPKEEKLVDLRTGLDEKIRNSSQYRSHKAFLEKEIDKDGNKNTPQDVSIKLEKWVEEQIQKDLKYKQLNEDINNSTQSNTTRLLAKINSLDSSGKIHGLEVGTTFSDDKDGYFTVESIDSINSTITLSNGPRQLQTLHFSDFLYSWEQQNPKRVAKSTSFEDTFDKYSGKEGWSDFKIKNGKIVKRITKETKNTSNKQNTDDRATTVKEELGETYSYLISKGGKADRQIVKILKNNGDTLTVQFGTAKYSEKKAKKDEVAEKDTNKDNWEIGSTKYTITPGFLEAFIAKHKLVPRSETEGKDKEKQNNAIDQAEMKGSFFSKIFKNYSISEVIAGGTLFVESFEKFLKEGNDEHAAKFAGLLGKLTGSDEVKADLKSRLESEQKKRQDDYIQKLKDVDSSDATIMIERRLLNKDSPEYKKVAGLMFMYEKYGTLYAKIGLNKYSGSFLWYKAFGGEIGDELFNKVKANAESDDTNFVEEILIYELMKQQCGSNWKKYGAPERRRSRIHKEVKKAKEMGKEEEYETGKKDAHAERSLPARIDFALNELKGGTFANGVGAIEEIIDKGGDLHEMNKVPFVLFYSGMAYKLDRELQDKLKGLTGGGRVLYMLRMLSYTGDINTMNKTILNLSQKISSAVGNPKMYQESKEIFNDIHASGSNFSKISRVVDFYDRVDPKTGKTYGELLTSSMYGIDSSDTSEYSYLNHLIYTDSDFEGYTAQQKELIEADTEYDKVEDYVFDSFNNTGNHGLGMRKFTYQTLALDTGGKFRQSKAGPYAWNNYIVSGFEGIINRTYPGGDAEKKEILLMKLQEFVSGIVEVAGRVENLQQYNIRGYKTAGALNRWGINLRRIASAGYSSDAIIKGDANGEFLDGIADNMINGIDMTGSTEVEGKSYSDQQKEVKDKTGEIIDE